MENMSVPFGNWAWSTRIPHCRAFHRPQGYVLLTPVVRSQVIGVMICSFVKLIWFPVFSTQWFEFCFLKQGNKCVLYLWDQPSVFEDRYHSSPLVYLFQMKYTFFNCCKTSHNPTCPFWDALCLCSCLTLWHPEFQVYSRCGFLRV